MTDSTKIKALQYTRVSTARQREDGTIQSQEQAIKNYLAAHPEIVVIGRFIDDGFSGAAIDGRDGYKQMLEALVKPDVQALIVYDIDRLDREFSNGFSLLQKCWELDKRIITVRNGVTFNLRDDADAIKTIFASYSAGIERQKNSDRIKSGINRVRAEGKRLGRPPVDVNWKEFDEYRASGLSIAKASHAMGLKPRTIYKRLQERDQCLDRTE